MLDLFDQQPDRLAAHLFRALPVGRQPRAQHFRKVDAVVPGDAHVARDRKPLLFELVQSSYKGEIIGVEDAGRLFRKAERVLRTPESTDAELLALKDTVDQLAAYYEDLGWWQDYYDEGVFVGYRWYDTKGIPVDFPFGHGLSYTEFEYGSAALSKAAVKCAGSYAVDDAALGKEVVSAMVRVRNAGGCDGAEVVQVYVAAPETGIERPLKELRGFDKIFLTQGASGTVRISLPLQSFTRFDEASHSWIVDPGTYRILIGSTSADIRSELEITVYPANAVSAVLHSICRVCITPRFPGQSRSAAHRPFRIGQNDRCRGGKRSLFRPR